jgi:phosphatidylglycerol:prolipoprotein diacylglycerol transferase
LGLEPSDIIVSLEGTAILSSDDLDEHWPELGKRTHQPVTLGVRGKAGDRSLTIPPAASPPLHPTQLYSAVDGLILCLFLLAVRGTRPPAGTVTAWLAVIYSVSRFLIEGIRSDERPAVGGLSISQVISLVLFGAGLLLLALAWMPTRTRTT